MSYPRQDSVMRRLQAESLSALDKVKAQRSAKLKDAWRRTSRLLRDDIMSAYRWAAPSGNWHLGSFNATERILDQRVRHVLVAFHAETTRIMATAFRDLRRDSALRHAWALDQVTPDSTPITIKNYNHQIREADVPLKSTWTERWAEWVNAYDSSLMSNLRMNALNEGSLEDAMAEVAATRANTPAFTLESALDRLFEYEAVSAMAGGMHQVVEDNPDLAEVEIWRTRGDLRVCDDCDANEGLTAEEADGDIPLHPNCNCFWQIVPPSFAELLRSGDEDDQALARRMDYEGLAPNALVVTDDNGDPVGKAIVDFEEWLSGRGTAVAGR